MSSKEELLKKLEEVNLNLTEDTIKSASSEDLKKFIELAGEIRRKLALLESLE